MHLDPIARRLVTALVVSAIGWAWPIPVPHPVIRPYAAPATPYSAGHRGIDIAASVGTTVLAPADGVVHFAGVVVDRPVLTIAFPGDMLVSVEPVLSTLHVGDAVARGQPVGTLVAGSHCGTTPCLHLGVRVRGDYVSPLCFLGGVPRAILYPRSGPPPNRTRGPPGAQARGCAVA